MSGEVINILPPKYWWLSFADASLPTGTQFLGALVIQGWDFMSAIENSHLFGLNPGGEVQGLEIIADRVEDFKPYANKLMDREACENLAREIG